MNRTSLIALLSGSAALLSCTGAIGSLALIGAAALWIQPTPSPGELPSPALAEHGGAPTGDASAAALDPDHDSSGATYASGAAPRAEPPHEAEAEAEAASTHQATPTAAPDRSAAATGVFVNGQRLSTVQLRQLQRAFGPVPGGRYWYDATSGLYGLEGGPPAGALPAGQPIGTLSADASRGRSGVYLNGRQLPVGELMLYSVLLGPIVPGRYWLDGAGNIGIEGMPVALSNLAARAGGSPADRWLSGAEWSGEASIGGGSMSSGTWDRSGGGNHVISLDGEVLTLP